MFYPFTKHLVGWAWEVALYILALPYITSHSNPFYTDPPGKYFFIFGNNLGWYGVGGIYKFLAEL